MKWLAIFTGLFIVSFHGIGQFKINLHNGWGYNLVNIEDATGSPKFDLANPSDARQLTDWDQFYYNGEIQVIRPMNEKLDLGLVAGFNRLYFWEERYRNLFDANFQFDFGTIWTFEVSALLNYYWSDQWFVTTSLGFHSFQDGSGGTVGTTAGFGRVLPLNERISLPLVFKIDAVFGDAASISPNLGIGIQWNILKP